MGTAVKKKLSSKEYLRTFLGEIVYDDVLTIIAQYCDSVYMVPEVVKQHVEVSMALIDVVESLHKETTSRLEILEGDMAKVIEVLQKKDSAIKKTIPYTISAHLRGARRLIQKTILDHYGIKIDKDDHQFQTIQKFASRPPNSRKPIPEIIESIRWNFGIDADKIKIIFQHGYQDVYNDIIHVESRTTQTTRFLSEYAEAGEDEDANVFLDFLKINPLPLEEKHAPENELLNIFSDIEGSPLEQADFHRNSFDQLFRLKHSVKRLLTKDFKLLDIANPMNICTIRYQPLNSRESLPDNDLNDINDKMASKLVVAVKFVRAITFEDQKGIEIIGQDELDFEGLQQLLKRLSRYGAAALKEFKRLKDLDQMVLQAIDQREQAKARGSFNIFGSFNGSETEEKMHTWVIGAGFSARNAHLKDEDSQDSSQSDEENYFIPTSTTFPHASSPSPSTSSSSSSSPSGEEKSGGSC